MQVCDCLSVIGPELCLCLQVIMSSSRRPGKEVATSSQKKCSRSGNVPLASVVPKGQTRVQLAHGSGVLCQLTPEARSHHVTVRGVPDENLDYVAPLYPAPMDITWTKGPDTEFGPTLTTIERHRRNELIMVRMYNLEMLRHQNGCHASTDIQLGKVERRYLLNNYARALLGIDLAFREPVDNDIPTDEEHVRTGSDVDSDSEEEIDPAQADDAVDEGDAMED
ncbi:hypothetical protein H5410_002031 [Solanum commersonii]|uniref:Uncharacterized protein n=1 Tax=Solanum commersonii TaxID=4109 RepID=A0A9J6B171_SOLCO|nr:hypothetical protein H5410_002031 [Solanum commersonii]